jgi:DNA-binding protein Fis
MNPAHFLSIACQSSRHPRASLQREELHTSDSCVMFPVAQRGQPLSSRSFAVSGRILIDRERRLHHRRGVSNQPNVIPFQTQSTRPTMSLTEAIANPLPPTHSDRSNGIDAQEFERFLEHVEVHSGNEPLSLRAWLHLAEAWRITQALRSCEGNRSAAARALGIGRRTLYAKMEKLGITPSWGL